MEKIEAFRKQMNERSNEYATSEGRVEKGRWVTIVGLQSEGGKKMNGKVGLIEKEEPNTEGRYQVHVDGTNKIKLIKESNVEPVTEFVKTYRHSCNGERSPNEVLLFPRAHSMFRMSNPNLSLAMNCCGLPLVVEKVPSRTKLHDRAQYDNQHATWLMINPISGFAPPEWQSFVGPVLMYRADGVDFSVDDYDVCSEFVSNLLDEFGEGPDFDPSTWLNPAFFRGFVRELVASRSSTSMGSNLNHLNIVYEN